MSENSEELKIGTEVWLISGSPSMTINKILDDGKIETTWYDEETKKFNHHTFKKEQLTTDDPYPSGGGIHI